MFRRRDDHGIESFYNRTNGEGVLPRRADTATAGRQRAKQRQFSNRMDHKIGAQSQKARLRQLAR